MNSQEAPVALTTRITAHLPLAEKILLTSLAVGSIMIVMQIDSSVAGVSLIGLAITFFLSAYKPINVSGREDEVGGFSELLGLMILPKVLWISSAISAFGVASYILGFGNEGYKNMLMIGGTSIAIGTMLLVTLMTTGVKHMQVVMPILLRAVPLCVVDFYILFK